MGVLTHSWHSNSASPVEVHMAQMECQIHQSPVVSFERSLVVQDVEMSRGNSSLSRRHRRQEEVVSVRFRQSIIHNSTCE